jgi:hypothetical protein
LTQYLKGFLHAQQNIAIAALIVVLQGVSSHRLALYMNIFFVWVVFMAVFVSLLVITLAIPSIASEYRILSESGVRKRTYVFFKFFVGSFLGGNKTDRAFSFDISEAEQLKGVDVYFTWDIRWVADGRELGKVVDVIQSSNTVQLVIKPLTPVTFEADGKEHDKIVFEPYNQRALIKRNKISSISGIIHVPGELEESKYAGAITCRLVSL